MIRAAEMWIALALALALASAGNLTPDAHALAGPQKVSVVSVQAGASTAVVGWSVDMPARVVVQYGVDDRFGVWSPTQAVLNAGPGQTTLTGLEPGTQYLFRVVTDSGQGLASADGSFRTAPLSATPRASIVAPTSSSAASTASYFAAPRSQTGPTALYVDDSPLFPRLVWRQCPYGYAQNLAAGINLFLGTSCVDPASQLQLLAGRAFSALDEGLLGRVAGPGLLGWHLPDEADETVAHPGELPLIHDPGRVTFLTLTDHFLASSAPPRYGRGVYPPLYARTDVVGFDTYPIEGRCRLSLIPNVYWQQRELVNDAPGKPTFQWIEAGPMEKCFSVDPTPATVRAESWLAIAGGARGIGYFPGVWAANIQAQITQIDRDIVALAPALLDTTAGGSANSSSSVLVGVRQHQGATYVIAVNPTLQSRAAVHLTVPGLGSRTLQVFDENRAVQAQGDQIVDDFPPLAARVYIAAPTGW